MSVLFVVFILAMALVAVAIGAFVWAVKSGQFDDVDTPQVRILFDDERASSESSSETEE